MMQILKSTQIWKRPLHWLCCVSAVLVGLSAAQGQPLVFINEMVASNASTLADEDGEYSDWMELYNGGTEAVDLTGYGVSDDPVRPFRWRIPAVSIEAGGYLLVWASGKDRAPVDGELHTNFSISAAGERLTLTAADGTVVDSVAPVVLGRDEVYARIPDGGEWGRGSVATPFAPNSGNVGRQLEPPEFSRGSGLIGGAFDLELSSTDPDVRILYTLDGSEPKEDALNGSIYLYKNSYPSQPDDPVGELLADYPRTLQYSGNPIRIEGSQAARLFWRATTNERSPERYLPHEAPFAGQVVRARAVKEGHPPSRVVSRTYFTSGEEPQAAGAWPHLTGLPAVNITVSPQDLFDYYAGVYTAGFLFDRWRQDFPNESTELWGGFSNFFLTGSEHQKSAHFEYYDSDGQLVLDRAVGLRIHGGTTRSFPQKSLRIYSGDVYDPRGGLEFTAFEDQIGLGTGLPILAHRILIMRNGGNDAFGTRFRDALGQAVLSPLGLDQQAWQPALHYLNGEFWGITNFRERLDRFYIKSHHGVDPSDVAMIEFTVAGEELDEGNPTDLQGFLALREAVRTSTAPAEEVFAMMDQQIDMDNFLLYHMGQIFLKNTDWPGSNIRIWRTNVPNLAAGAPAAHDGRWRYIFSDLDFGFGPFWGEDVDHNTLELALAEGGDAWPNPDWSTVLLRRAVEFNPFRNRLIQAFADHMNTTFHPRRVHPLIDSMDALVRPALDLHARRWRDFENLPPDVYHDFIDRRPGIVQQHLMDRFQLSGMANLTVSLSLEAGAEVQLNTIRLRPEAAGLADPDRPFPWTGSYFRGVRLEIQPLPYTGYEFIGWRDGAGAVSHDPDLVLQENREIVGLLQRSLTGHLLHYWNFDDFNYPLEPAYSIGEASLGMSAFGETEFQSVSQRGFADSGAMMQEGAGLQLSIVRPVGSLLEMRVPTVGFRNVRLEYLTLRTPDAPQNQWIEYALDGESFQFLQIVPVSGTTPQRVVADLSVIEGTDNNSQLALRIRFAAGTGANSGEHLFDALSVRGDPILTDAQALAYAGIHWDGGWYETAGTGLLATPPSAPEFLYQSEASWWYVHQPQNGPGYWIHDYPSGGWFWVYSAQVPYWYSIAESKWTEIPTSR